VQDLGLRDLVQIGLGEMRGEHLDAEEISPCRQRLERWKVLTNKSLDGLIKGVARATTSI
jgi:hypothetical protein